MIKVVVACDSFKGSLTAAEATASAAVGVKDALGCNADIVDIPVADGGEGTATIITAALGGKSVHCRSHDAIGRSVECCYGIVDAGGMSPLGVIELAEASGLTRLTESGCDSLRASTRGTGELIADAYFRGCRRFVIGLGGSATTDGGTGLLRALGVRFLDSRGIEIGEGGGELPRLASIDMSHARKDILECRFTILCDVTNPLTGVSGAAAVFAPQKGASAGDVEILERGLARYAAVIRDTFGIDVAQMAGAGAAGGTAAAFMAFFNSEISRGIAATLDLCGFEKKVCDADLVITGEGKIDLQTLGGKAPMGVLEVACRHKVPVVVLAGSVSDSLRLCEAGFAGVYPINPPGMPLEEAMRTDVAGRNLRDTASRVVRSRFAHVIGQG
ncbi:MAG: glycerate kinase [Bacteroidales bacterium]|nr:glycerate kinase [Bacteroidales bacterium]